MRKKSAGLVVLIAAAITTTAFVGMRCNDDSESKRNKELDEKTAYILKSQDFKLKDGTFVSCGDSYLGFTLPSGEFLKSNEWNTTFGDSYGDARRLKEVRINGATYDIKQIDGQSWQIVYENLIERTHSEKMAMEGKQNK